MTHGLSPLYFSCLLKLSKTTFDFIKHPDIASMRSDGSSCDQLFLNAIPFLAKYAKTKVPNLLQTAQLAEENKPFNVYNKDTYMEFCSNTTVDA